MIVYSIQHYTCKVKDSHRPRTESPNSRKERKKLVREQKAEKREVKMKKHVKKCKVLSADYEGSRQFSLLTRNGNYKVNFFVVTTHFL